MTSHAGDFARRWRRPFSVPDTDAPPWAHRVPTVHHTPHTVTTAARAIPKAPPLRHDRDVGGSGRPGGGGGCGGSGRLGDRDGGGGGGGDGGRGGCCGGAGTTAVTASAPMAVVAAVVVAAVAAAVVVAAFETVVPRPPPWDRPIRQEYRACAWR